MEQNDHWARLAIEQNSRWLNAYFLATCGDPHLAEDLVQETLSAAYQSRERYKPGAPFGAWLRGIAKNLLRREFDRKKRRFVVVEENLLTRLDAYASASEERFLDSAYLDSKLDALKKCWERLGKRAKELLSLRYIKNLSMKAVSDELSLSQAAVGTGTFRSRAALLDCVSRYLGGGGEEEA